MANNQPPPVPKMYLAQIEGRCSLHYAAEADDRQQWLKEWVDPKQDGNSYQYNEPKLGIDGSTYRIKIEFPNSRVFSNCGQDSILCPVLGKNGIPYIPGSSIKGMFRRVCNDQQKIQYCGDADCPGKLRFHGAYPVGNWTGKHPVKEVEDGQKVTKTCYFIEDIVHPQQKRQVEAEDSPKAIVIISFYQPKFIFEFSSPDATINWQEVEKLLHKALRRGLGGKTSTGYGLDSKIGNNLTFFPEYAQTNSSSHQNALHIKLSGSGVSSVLLSKDPEFRPNLFKAALRGHTSRLLAGVCNNENAIRAKVDTLFGSTNAPGIVEIFWESKKVNYNIKGKNPTYTTESTLHIHAPKKEQEFIQWVLKFAYIMGGFGKSWRRVSHEKFYQSYYRVAIGCHWQCSDSNFINIQTCQDLKTFLNDLHEQCKTYLNLTLSHPFTSWREAWHPNCVSVYSRVGSESTAIKR